MASAAVKPNNNVAGAGFNAVIKQEPMNDDEEQRTSSHSTSNSGDEYELKPAITNGDGEGTEKSLKKETQSAANSEDEDELKTDNLSVICSSPKTGDAFTLSTKRHILDAEHSQAKKRRKQSNPVRIATPVLDEAEAGHDGPDSEDEDRLDEVRTNNDHILVVNKNFQQASVNNIPNLNGGNISPSANSQTNPCPHCSEPFHSEEELKIHVENGHVQRLLQGQVQHKSSLELYPIKKEAPLNLSNVRSTDSVSPIDFGVIGAWAADLQMKTEPRNDVQFQGTKPSAALPQASLAVPPFRDGKMLLPGFLPLGPPFLLPTIISQGPSTPLAHQPTATIGSGTPIRIFNPEAYCELCNKEFCNKYFLKTHKANKHGIYVENPGPTMAASTLTSSPYPSAFVATNVNPPPLRPAIPATQPISKSQSSAISNTGEVSNTKSPGSSIMKAFCDICQKKFCNKYFVRRHKAKIHGIVEENMNVGTGVHGNSNACNITATSTGSQVPANVDIDDCQGKEDEETKQMNGTENTSSSHDTSPNASSAIEFHITEAEAEDVSQSESDKMSDNKSNFVQNNHNLEEETCLEVSPKIEAHKEYEQTQDNSKSSTDVNTTTEVNLPTTGVQLGTLSPANACQNVTPGSIPKNATFSPERLRRLGVINADAFCEICCKEYCNKYFLRTHKMKRHGIVTPDNNGDGKSPSMNTGHWCQAQTSPLNLIMNEQCTNSSDSTEKAIHEPRIDIFEGEDPECDICGRKFQNIYLMQMHRAYIHCNSNNEREADGSTQESPDSKPQCFENKPSEDSSAHNSDPGLTTELSNEVNGNNGRDNISEDLQKLQTMILQLNDLNVGRTWACNICHKELGNRYYLRAHMMTEHGILFDEEAETTSEKLSSSEEVNSKSPTSTLDPQTYCNICKKDFVAKYFLLKHMASLHGNNTIATSSNEQVKEEIDVKEDAERFNPPEKRVSLAPASSYCEICNKELCNKYFMKTHMQRMHGIEIENGAQIGGVICDICNKELCSKYFLRVHKQNTHGIVEDPPPTQSNKDIVNSSSQSQHENDTSLKPLEVGDLNNRYYTYFTEVCSICSRRFRSSKWLKAHLTNDHGDVGREKWKEIEAKYQSQQNHNSKQIKNMTSNTLHTKNATHATTIYSHISNTPSGRNIMSHQKVLDVSAEGSCQRQLPMESTEQQTNEAGNISGSQHIFAGLFGSGDPPVKSYHCSYCSFSTPVLAFLFVHERSHTGLPSQTIPDPRKPFQCPVCLQSFMQIELFQHHLLTHQFSGLLNPFLASPSLPPYSQTMERVQIALKRRRHSQDFAEEADEEHIQEDRRENEGSDEESSAAENKCKYKCTKCSQRFRTRELCVSHVQSNHGPSKPLSSPSPPSPLSLVDAASPSKFQAHQAVYKCLRCEFSSIHLVTLKKHIRKDHKSDVPQGTLLEQDPELWWEIKDAVSVDMKKKLQDTAKKSHMPATYAVPQSHRIADGFIMQPFLLEETNNAKTTKQNESMVPIEDGKFVPSLVFLPVKEKLSEPRTVSFNLTPA